MLHSFVATPQTILPPLIFTFFTLTIAAMPRVFNICFAFRQKTYTALVSVMSHEDHPVQVTTSPENITLILPGGNLTISIADVLQTLYASREQGRTSESFYLTQNISLQFLNTDW